MYGVSVFCSPIGIYEIILFLHDEMLPSSDKIDALEGGVVGAFEGRHVSFATVEKLTYH